MKLSGETLELSASDLSNFLGCRHRTGRDMSVALGAEKEPWVAADPCSKSFGHAGGFVLRLSFPDGYQIPVHWHPMGENATVLQGSLSLGVGNTFDASALHTYGVGDFAYLPSLQSHFGQAHGATIVQINGRGPFAINPGAAK
jgi:quercetin dioxygenase-like cupin family protein